MKNEHYNPNLYQNLLLVSLVTLLFAALPFDIFATTTDPNPSPNTSSSTQPTTALETILCNGLEIIQGGVGRAIAIFAIIFIGISLFMGKVSWGLAISTALGIGAIFGAASVVEALGAGDSTCDGYEQISGIS